MHLTVELVALIPVSLATMPDPRPDRRTDPWPRGSPIIYLAMRTCTLKLVAAGTVADYQGHVSTAEVVPTAGDEVKTIDTGRHRATRAVARRRSHCTSWGTRTIRPPASRGSCGSTRASKRDHPAGVRRGRTSAPATPSVAGEVTLGEGN